MPFRTRYFSQPENSFAVAVKRGLRLRRHTPFKGSQVRFFDLLMKQAEAPVTGDTYGLARLPKGLYVAEILKGKKRAARRYC
jgi:hypothetical protein